MCRIFREEQIFISLKKLYFFQRYLEKIKIDTLIYLNLSYFDNCRGLDNVVYDVKYKRNWIIMFKDFFFVFFEKKFGK